MKKTILASLLFCTTFAALAHDEPRCCVQSKAETSIATDASEAVVNPIFFIKFRLWFKRTVIHGAGGLECPPGEGICSVTTEGGASGGDMVTSGGGDVPIYPGTYVAVDYDGNFCYYVTDVNMDRSLAGSVFVQSGEFKIDGKLAAELKISPQTIRPGKYPVMHDGKAAVVVFSQKGK